MDLTVFLVGHPNLTGVAVGPGAEAWRHYSWSFNLRATARKQARDLRDNSRRCHGIIFVNSKDVALLARYDHVVSKCAKMVERNPVVVRCEAPPDRRKQRDGMCITVDLEDGSAFCDENVARVEPGIRGHRWSYSQVFFPAGTKPRSLREQRDIPVAVDLIDVLGAKFGHEKKIRRSGHARGKGDTSGKGNWMGLLGVKHSCER